MGHRELAFIEADYVWNIGKKRQISFCLLIMILVVPTLLQEPKQQISAPAKVEVRANPPLVRKLPRLLSHRKSLVRTLEEIDKKHFLSLMQSQGGEDLYQCLKGENVQSPFVLSAQLSRSGLLINPQHLTIQRLERPPECLTVLFQKMNFSELTQQLKTNFIEIQWSLEF